MRREVEDHFRRVSADLPFYRRIQVLRFFAGELPRTSTRKVKRPLVVEELRRLGAAAERGDRVRLQAPVDTDWLTAVIAAVAQKPVHEIAGHSQIVGDLGFDSLLLTELSVALEQAGVPGAATADLTSLSTVEDLRRWVGQRRASRAQEDSGQPQSWSGIEEIIIPEALSNLGRKALSAGQSALYRKVFRTKVHGTAFIPQNRNFIVAANHASHLDMGLVKMALGSQGERLVTLAAKDYFFNTTLKQLYFENFTNLVPMERRGSLRESLKLAGESLHQGYNLLIFPEGTRSATGELMEFKATLGYLALSYNVDILPMYLHGTYEALPKGGLLPKLGELEVRIGPVLEISALRELAVGTAKSVGYREVTGAAYEAVVALSKGDSFSLARRIEAARAAATVGGDPS